MDSTSKPATGGAAEATHVSSVPVATPKKKTRKPLPSIGWREWAALPDLGVEAIRVKVDTGARTSSLHAFKLEEFEKKGETYVRFEIHPKQRSKRGAITVEVPMLEKRMVRNPGDGGREELRPVIVTDIEIGGKRWPIEITLARRDEMTFRMLIGRQAVRRRFVVDPGRSYIARKNGGTK